MAMSERRPIVQVNCQSNWLMNKKQETKNEKKTSDPGRRAILNEKPPARGDVTMGAFILAGHWARSTKAAGLVTLYTRCYLSRKRRGWWRASRR